MMLNNFDGLFLFVLNGNQNKHKKNTLVGSHQIDSDHVVDLGGMRGKGSD
jgi:hypothetical protein